MLAHGSHRSSTKYWIFPSDMPSVSRTRPRRSNSKVESVSGQWIHDADGSSLVGTVELAGESFQLKTSRAEKDALPRGREGGSAVRHVHLEKFSAENLDLV